MKDLYHLVGSGSAWLIQTLLRFKEEPSDLRSPARRTSRRSVESGSQGEAFWANEHYARTGHRYGAQYQEEVKEVQVCQRMQSR